MTILDTSKWQGPISVGTFAAARAAGVTRSIHKAGGSNAGRYTDSQYAHNAAAARAAGLPLGHYWFNGPGDPTADADYFIDNLVAYTPGDWLVLDIESTGTVGWSPAAALAFAARVYARTGVKPLLYMSSSVTRAADWSPLVAFGCPLWVAQYSASEPNVAHWSTWAAWQFTSSGTMPGIPTLVDLSHEGTPVPTATPAPVPEVPMTDYSLVKSSDNDTIWLSVDKMLRKAIASPAELADVLWQLEQAGGNAAACAAHGVDIVGDLDAFGVDITGLSNLASLTAPAPLPVTSEQIAAIAAAVAPLVVHGITSTLPDAIVADLANHLSSKG
ncbi:glycoside hydrolase family 25 protein [Curtobacterium oceanosedimentum]|uniref:glycoside hydrolase family 25 protein n=1 Tax=Curtobacterium oceanosedimentum TaxID=465820 RepID=UPI0033965333